MQTIIILAVLGVLSWGGARGSSHDRELDDAKLASVRGGYCFFFKCGRAADGDCQPIIDDAATMCMEVSCHLKLDSLGGVDVVECNSPDPKVTCSENETYIRCVRSRFAAVCFPDLGSTICGYEVIASCFPDIPNRRCYCDTYKGADSCEWQSCNPIGLQP